MLLFAKAENKKKATPNENKHDISKKSEQTSIHRTPQRKV